MDNKQNDNDNIGYRDSAKTQPVEEMLYMYLTFPSDFGVIISVYGKDEVIKFLADKNIVVEIYEKGRKDSVVQVFRVDKIDKVVWGYRVKDTFWHVRFYKDGEEIVPRAEYL